MSPYEIGILLHYHFSAEDHPDIDRQVPIWAPTIDAFVAEKLLEPCPVSPPPGHKAKVWSLTGRGRHYVVHGLCRVPLPVKEWRIPEANEWPKQCSGDERSPK